ncbi:hypothetical protein BDN70DRAFT_563305 [Pholiota conissans]|uniref:Uncharacterized protein n=1 Tax=Pholiota conissans TaxID=109636 RepID=A0A9P5YKK7_9AGAR|nr:hypothetical protein BDN70DRAFT_563305 [Pholiota conissans]
MRCYVVHAAHLFGPRTHHLRNHQQQHGLQDEMGGGGTDEHFSRKESGPRSTQMEPLHTNQYRPITHSRLLFCPPSYSSIMYCAQYLLSSMRKNESPRIVSVVPASAIDPSISQSKDQSSYQLLHSNENKTATIPYPELSLLSSSIYAYSSRDTSFLGCSYHHSRLYGSLRRPPPKSIYTNIRLRYIENSAVLPLLFRSVRALIATKLM